MVPISTCIIVPITTSKCLKITVDLFFNLFNIYLTYVLYNSLKNRKKLRKFSE